MKKMRSKLVVGFLIVFVILCLFVIWDNNRIKVVKQDIAIDNLPEQLEGFSILQVTDLHEHEFGKNQKNLLSAINELDYDVVVFTGDMLSSPQSTNVTPFYTLLEGLANKKHVLYALGNDDPFAYRMSPSFGKSEFITGMEKKGATFLEAIDTIHVEGANVHFVNFELSIIKNPGWIGMVNGAVQKKYAGNKRYLDYQKQLWEAEMGVINELDESDILVALNHYPIVDARIDYIQNDPNTEWWEFDLIIAGHYHGGQIRLPFFGALFVPESWYEPNGFFPPQDRVKGLWEYNGTKQYVSGGLGSSGAIPFLKFRLFNTPEINLLTFKRK